MNNSFYWKKWFASSDDADEIHERLLFTVNDIVEDRHIYHIIGNPQSGKKTFAEIIRRVMASYTSLVILNTEIDTPDFTNKSIHTYILIGDIYTSFNIPDGILYKKCLFDKSYLTRQIAVSYPIIIKKSEGWMEKTANRLREDLGINSLESLPPITPIISRQSSCESHCLEAISCSLLPIISVK